MRKANLKQEARQSKLNWMEMFGRLKPQIQEPTIEDIDTSIVDWTLFLYSDEAKTVEPPPIVLTQEMRKDLVFDNKDLTWEVNAEEYKFEELEGGNEYDAFVASDLTWEEATTVPGPFRRNPLVAPLKQMTIFCWRVLS
jgi:hypothetical protein